MGGRRRPVVRPGNRLPVPDPTGGRRRIAAHLAGHGPTWGDRLAEALGMTLEAFWALAGNCRWFELVVGGYGLTAEGRLEGLAPPASPASNSPPSW